MAAIDPNNIFSMAYELATEVGNSHCQASAYAEWKLFGCMAVVAPKGSYHAARHATQCLKKVAELKVIQP
jgi:hypothetical protein